MILLKVDHHAPSGSFSWFRIDQMDAIVQVRTLTEEKFGLAAVDGIADKSAGVLNLYLDKDDLLEPGSYPYALPGVEPRAAVDAVDVSQSGGRTSVSFGLPDATDDAAYGYQGDFYVGAPVSVKVPILGAAPNAAPTPMNNPTPDNGPTPPTGLSDGAIAGVVLGTLFGIALSAAVIAYLYGGFSLVRTQPKIEGQEI